MRRRDVMRAAPTALALAASPTFAQPSAGPPRPPSAAEVQARAQAARDAIRARMEARRAKLEDFRANLLRLLADLPLLERARGFRELEYRHAGLTGLSAATPRFAIIPASARSLTPGINKPLKVAEAVPAAPATSTLPIAQEAKDLIIEFEVSSAAIYAQRHQAPTWPGGNSGVTIGIGFDLGWCSAAAFAKAWGGILADPQTGALTPVCQLKADKAKAQAGQPAIKAVKVSWDQASAQFDRFLPLIVGETTGAFANCEGLSPESLGALVSLVYNRGSDHTNTPRRVEMFNIAALMTAKDYAAIPTQIRAMKRLWQDVPGAGGLVERRELEAKLFEAGLLA
jgi:hypothetical protein